MTDRPTVKGQFIALMIGIVFLTGLSEVALRLLFSHWREFYSGWFMTASYVPEYGTVAIGRPGFDGKFAQNNGDFRVRIRINQVGLRNEESAEAADGRIWVVGDSMAFGWGVERDETYTAVIAQESGKPTYNVASPGANICGYQALIGRMPKSSRPSAVIVGLILENDIMHYDCIAKARNDEMLNRVETTNFPEEGFYFPTSLSSLKRTLTRFSALYNFFAVAVKRVDVFQELLIKVGMIKRAHNDHFAPTVGDHEVLVNRTVRELIRLRSMVPNVPFAVLVAPARLEIRDDNRPYAKLRKRIDTVLRAEGFGVIDPFDHFKKAGMGPTHFAHDGHWSALGHRIAGKAAAAWVEQFSEIAPSRSDMPAKPR